MCTFIIGVLSLLFFPHWCNFPKVTFQIYRQRNRFFVTYAIRQTEIPALLDGWVETHLLSNYVFYVFKKESVEFVLSPLILCVGELRQIAVS